MIEDKLVPFEDAFEQLETAEKNIAEDNLDEAIAQLELFKEIIFLGPLIADYRGGTDQLSVLVKDALEAGANVNDDSCNGHRHLQLAIRAGHTAVVFLLIDAGADLNYRDKSWLDPIHTAINHGRFEVAKHLIRKGVHFNRCTPDLSYNYSNWYRFCFGV